MGERGLGIGTQLAAAMPYLENAWHGARLAGEGEAVGVERQRGCEPESPVDPALEGRFLESAWQDEGDDIGEVGRVVEEAQGERGVAAEGWVADGDDGACLGGRLPF